MSEHQRQRPPRAAHGAKRGGPAAPGSGSAQPEQPGMERSVPGAPSVPACAPDVPEAPRVPEAPSAAVPECLRAAGHVCRRMKRRAAQPPLACVSASVCQRWLPYRRKCCGKQLLPLSLPGSQNAVINHASPRAVTEVLAENSSHGCPAPASGKSSRPFFLSLSPPPLSSSLSHAPSSINLAKAIRMNIVSFCFSPSEHFYIHIDT